jgi:hypothetical protein
MKHFVQALIKTKICPNGTNTPAGAQLHHNYMDEN